MASCLCCAVNRRLVLVGLVIDGQSEGHGVTPIDLSTKPGQPNRRWRGRCEKRATYTYPSKQSLLSVMEKVRSLTRRNKHHSLAELIQALNRDLRGWCNYFRHGVSSRTFGYLDDFTFWRIVGWLRKRHLGLNWGTLPRRYLPGWEVRESSSELFRPARVEIVRYRY